MFSPKSVAPMAFTLDHNVLRNAQPKDLAQYLRNEALRSLDSLTISQRILAAVETEVLPPRVFALWASACPDNSAIITGFKQLHSIGSRLYAIKAFGRVFRTSQCVSLWQSLGGTERIVESMAEWSVDEVKMFCKLVGTCSTAVAEKSTRQKLVTELLQALLSQHFPESVFENPDRRPLASEYARLAHACTPDFVVAWRANKQLPTLNSEKVLAADPQVYTLKCLQAIDQGSDEIDEYLPLLYSTMSGPSQSDPSVSESTTFAVRTLEAFLTQKVLPVKHAQLGEVMLSLIKRASRRKTSKAFAARAVSVVVQCHQKWSLGKNTIELDEQHIVYHIVELWRRDPETFELDATYLLSRVPGRTCPSVRELAPIVSRDPRERRFRLLSWLMATMTSTRIDLNNAATFKRLTGYFPSKLLHVLPRTEALTLLDKLESAGKELDDNMNSPFKDGSTSFLRLSILKDPETVRHMANVEGLKCRKEAETSRDQSKRAVWAEHAFAFAIASRDLNIYSETLLWARRYNRDPLTVMSLYAAKVVQTVEAVNLLSGMTELPPNTSPDAIADRIRKGNATLMLLLETACMCMTEPSFQARHWDAVLDLFRSVVQVRCNEVNYLQTRLGLNDEQTYQLVWSDTLEMLLKVEQIGLDEKNKNLEFHSSGGPLAGGNPYMPSTTVRNASKATLRFVDEYASQRDALWQQYRPTVHPASASLTTPFPRGLPIQALDYFDFGPKPPRGSTPYLENRVRSIVFMNPGDAFSALPEDKDTQTAIGSFVDSYAVALRMYVGPPTGSGSGSSTSFHRSGTWGNPRYSTRGSGRGRPWPGRHNPASDTVAGELDSNGYDAYVARDEAWKYATTVLSVPSITPVEARLQWRSIFILADLPPSDEMMDLPQRPDPVFPDPDDLDDFNEWDPDLGCPSDVPYKELQPICLDMLTSWHSAIINVESGFSEPRPEIPAHKLPSFWNLDRYRGRIPHRAREAYIAVATLLVDSNAGADSKVLRKPFPSDADVRFPPVFLEGAFLERKDTRESQPVNILETLLIDVPPTLLKQMANATLKEWKADPNSGKPRGAIFFALVKLLAWGDKPDIALELITKVLVDMPNESSWHRELLHQGILKRLPAGWARKFMSGLGDRIFQKLEAQMQRTAESMSQSAPAVPGTVSKDAVKVTTVKMLAQVIQGATFVDEQFSLDVLLSLLTRSKHLDIRVAIVESLIAMLHATGSDDFRERILVALEKYAVPIAASSNERASMTEERWQTAAVELQVPDVGQSAEDWPISTILERATRTASQPALKAAMVKRLLLPMLEQSTFNNKLWTRLFLRKHNTTLLLDQLPAMPFRALQLTELIQGFPELVSPEQFELMSHYILTAYDPPVALEELNTSLREAPVNTRGANDVRHWLSQWDHSGTNALQPGSLRIAQLLCCTDWSTVTGGLTPTDLQNHERNVIDIMIEDYENRASDWTSYTERYSPRYFSHLLKTDRAESSAWVKYCKPVIEYMIEQVNARRTPEWQRDPNRKPAFLPDTFPLRLRLLPYPSDSSSCEPFAAEIIALIDELATSRRPYHAHFTELTKVAREGAAAGDGCYVALGIAVGDLRAWDGDLSLAELLRVELADALIASPDKTDHLPALKRMLDAWARSSDEEVRRYGIEKLRSLKKRAEREEKTWKIFL